MVNNKIKSDNVYFLIERDFLIMENIELKASSYDKFIFKGSLALEYYFDINNTKDNYIKLFNDFNKELKKYRMLSINDEKSKENIVQKIKSIILKLGKENFIIYEDGDVEYNLHNEQ